MTGCRGISCSEHFLVQLAVVRVPLPPSGMGATARYHRASPQGAELTARHITFSWLRRRAGGTGRTMLEWVLTDGFLEQVIRNEQVRQDIRTRIRGWP